MWKEKTYYERWLLTLKISANGIFPSRYRYTYYLTVLILSCNLTATNLFSTVIVNKWRKKSSRSWRSQETKETWCMKDKTGVSMASGSRATHCVTKAPHQQVSIWQRALTISNVTRHRASQRPAGRLPVRQGANARREEGRRRRETGHADFIIVEDVQDVVRVPEDSRDGRQDQRNLSQAERQEGRTENRLVGRCTSLVPWLHHHCTLASCVRGTACVCVCVCVCVRVCVCAGLRTTVIELSAHARARARAFLPTVTPPFVTNHCCQEVGEEGRRVKWSPYESLSHFSSRHSNSPNWVFSCARSFSLFNRKKCHGDSDKAVSLTTKVDNHIGTVRP